jgi:multidrug transporter EmrE-like cation transporter
MLCDLVLSTVKQHIYAKPVKWSVRLFLDNITLMFLLNFLVEVIINMFIKRRNTKLTHHTLHLIFETNALFMVSLVAKPVEFGLSYNFESLGSVIFWT